VSKNKYLNYILSFKRISLSKICNEYFVKVRVQSFSFVRAEKAKALYSTIQNKIVKNFGEQNYQSALPF
jgi:hypothetical protein